MDIAVVFLPRDLQPEHLAGRAVVVFDVLRATTSMTAALAAGVREIRVFGDLSAARAAAAAFDGPPGTRLVCGEENCLRPAGFDLGNSPGAFDAAACAGRVAFMSTTNGTRAILTARGAGAILTGALVNAGAVARSLAALRMPVTLLCAGTNGRVAMEDVIGAGAVIDALTPADGPPAAWRLAGDTALIARHLFAAARGQLPRVLAEADGGRNVLAAGLGRDIDFAARVDVLGAVGMVDGAAESPVVRPWPATAADSAPPAVPCS